MNSLKTILECPVCLTMVRSSPVPSCHNGHIVCTSCWNMTHLCPLCRVKLHETEKCFSQPANTLLQMVTVPCLYEDEGCTFQGKKTEVEQHQQNCLFKHFNQEKETLTGCPVTGCRIGKQKKLDKKKIGTRPIEGGLSARQEARLSAPTTSAPRRHCDDCNRDFSRRYFTRHVCSQGVTHQAQNN